MTQKLEPSYNAQATIYHDPKRTNSQYYALVEVTKIDFNSTKYSHYKNLEIILNGHGESKCKKKIERALKTEGVNIGNRISIACYSSSPEQ